MASPNVPLQRTLQAARISSFSRQSSLLRTQRLPLAQIPSMRRRTYASSHPTVTAPDYLDERERKIFNIVKENLDPEKLEVQDISGGCGSMYALDIVSDQFKGLPVIKQHRLVNKVLGEEIKKWHGVQLKTNAP